MKTIHLRLQKQGFTSLTMDNYQLKNHVFLLSFHTPQKNNNPQLMTQQFGFEKCDVVIYSIVHLLNDTATSYSTEYNYIWNLKPLQYAQ